MTAGSVLGVTALSKKNQSRDRCPKDPCDAGAVELGQAAGRAADWATVSFAVGLSSAAVGTLLLLTSDPSASASAARAPRVGWALSPEATPHGGGLSVGGRFW